MLDIENQHKKVNEKKMGHVCYNISIKNLNILIIN